MTYKLLDLFCGAGGAAMGYHKAGFEVVGVDAAPQPSYPFEFHHQLAELVLEDTEYLQQFDVVHASPPCQFYSKNTTKNDDTPPGLIKYVRTYLERAGVDYVIENVTGAKDYMVNPQMLCGVVLGRPVRRHRLFETTFVDDIKWPPHHKRICWGSARKFAEERGVSRKVVSVTGNSSNTGTIELWKEIMDMPWAERGIDLREAIFPVYTEYLGKEIIKALDRRSV